MRRPRDERELLYFQPTEVVLLTGLGWGEAAGVIWRDISWAGWRIHVRRAVACGQDDPNEPTKTAAK